MRRCIALLSNGRSSTSSAKISGRSGENIFPECFRSCEMPVYDLSELHDRLALMLSQPDAKRMKSIAYLIERNYGPKAVEELRKEYKRVVAN